MTLITRLKIGNVNNLSDARYAAGVGADFIGFSFDLESPMYVSPEKVKEITAWIEGPAITGEFGYQDADEIQTISDILHLDYVQFNIQRDSDLHKKINAGIFQTIKLDVFKSRDQAMMYLEDIETHCDFILLALSENIDLDYFMEQETNEEFVREICRKYPTFLDFQFSKDNMLLFIEKFQPEGINLNGESEIKPGLRDFDRLTELVELLEAQNI